MKRFVCILMVALSALPAWSAKKVTVAELSDMLKSMHDQQKPDADVAAALKQVQLSELLSRDMMNNWAAYSPGPLTNEQIYVLEARSANMPPPAADLPNTAAPDAAAQKAILDKASAYATKTWAQLPALTATKTTLRFQDNVEAPATSSGMAGGAKEVAVGSSFVSPFQFVHYIGSTESVYTSDHGIEKLPEDKTKWGANRMIGLQEPDPSVGTVFQDAQNGGTINWLRWENVNGKAAAVFSFQVPKKKSHINTNVCCFPNVDQTGVARFSSAAIAGATGGSGGATGNFQTNTDYVNHFKANGVPYHGEFFIDPDTGIVVRMITQLELKQSEVVHQLDTRVDYGPAKVGDKDLILPMKTVINTEVVPNGDSQAAGKFSTRATLFTIEYKDFKPK
ncbi:MAG: hypothetical protein JST28_15080 [Acidobacteria bacterium]|nr:hypothetical protein [Acidobacteriota bacterium]